MLRAYKIRKMELTDHQKLPSISIARSGQPFQFINAIAHKEYKKLKIHLDSNLLKTQTAAFLVIRNDSIIYERYSMGFNENSILPSNSMAKSFTGTLTGIAIDEGKILSAAEPITNYLPELRDRDHRFTRVTIRHLLNMRSGFDFNEGSYNLKDDAIKLGLRHNLEKHILLKAKIADAPGKYKYQSINTQLLGLIIERATEMKLQDYLEEKLWKPMGAENEATWNVDSKKRKHVITSAGINATARDFAKLGLVYLKKGKWNSHQTISPGWIETISNVDTMEKHEGYKNQWWNRRLSQSFYDSLKALGSNRKKRDQVIQRLHNSYQLDYWTEAYSAIGFLNQIIYVNPGKNLIIVRLGKRWPCPTTFIQFIHNLGEQI